MIIPQHPVLNFFKRRVRINLKPQTLIEDDKITEKYDTLVFGKEKEKLASQLCQLSVAILFQEILCLDLSL